MNPYASGSLFKRFGYGMHHAGRNGGGSGGIGIAALGVAGFTDGRRGMDMEAGCIPFPADSDLPTGFFDGRKESGSSATLPTASGMRRAPPQPAYKSNKKAKPSAKQKKPSVDYTANPGQFVKQRVAKDFGDDIYFGTIDRFERDDEDANVVYWKITYDDGDLEDFDEKDLRAALKMYDACKHNDTKPKTSAGSDADADGDADDDVDGKPMEEVGGGDDDDENHSKADANAENEGEDADEI